MKLPAEREVLLNIDTVRPENSLWSNLFAPEEVWSGYAGIRVGDMKLLLGDPGFPRAQCPATYRKVDHEASAGKNGTWVGDLLDRSGGCNAPTGRKGRGRSPDIFPRARSSVLLFNVSEDPGETLDLSEVFPDVVTDLQARIRAQEARAIKAVNANKPGADMESHPDRHGGIFGPWVRG